MPTQIDEVEALRSRLEKHAAARRLPLAEKRARLMARYAELWHYDDVDKLVRVAERAMLRIELGKIPPPEILIHVSDELRALAAENVGQPGSDDCFELSKFFLGAARKQLRGEVGHPR